MERITYLGSKIFFENNSATLKVASLVQLDELVTLINKYDASNLVIEGHADSNGSDAFNLELSQKRTDSVKEYLMKKGVSESRVKAIGFGESKPIASNATALGRAKNRRVELKMSYEK
ncbi:OmpA family protein [Flavobacterium galactosidilyticum]|nr:OmpA family protein [Flavobacterium sp. F-340]